MNGIQLFNEGKRYYIINIFWCAESMGFALPEKYVKEVTRRTKSDHGGDEKPDLFVYNFST